mmetsp:Transcript_30504/g.72438  ORF Transcript_30504/g.72438 Transcript_30504/m.72438 type:complete len:227 (+) Transcript_30504:1060-1740(+)
MKVGCRLDLGHSLPPARGEQVGARGAAPRLEHRLDALVDAHVRARLCAHVAIPRVLRHGAIDMRATLLLVVLPQLRARREPRLVHPRHRWVDRVARQVGDQRTKLDGAYGGLSLLVEPTRGDGYLEVLLLPIEHQLLACRWARAHTARSITQRSGGLGPLHTWRPYGIAVGPRVVLPLQLRARLGPARGEQHRPRHRVLGDRLHRTAAHRACATQRLAQFKSRLGM